MFSIPLHRKLTYVFHVRPVWVMVGEHPEETKLAHNTLWIIWLNHLNKK
jgi:hypothetical protein